MCSLPFGGLDLIMLLVNLNGLFVYSEFIVSLPEAPVTVNKCVSVGEKVDVYNTLDLVRSEPISTVWICINRHMNTTLES